MIPTFSSVKKIIDELAAKIQAPNIYLPTYGNSLDGGHPYIEIDKSGLLFYLAKERGSETMRYIAKDIDDLLYHVFKDITFMMALKYELKNRILGQDSRRVFFVEQERLLGILNEEWKIRKQKEHEKILINNPFDDYASERIDYYKSIVASGMNLGKEWAIACEKYPLPSK